MRIGYFADGPWSHRALDKVLADETLEIAFICARYDNPDPVLKHACKINGIQFLVHSNINSGEFLETAASYKCDMLVSMSFNQIFKKEIINLTEKKAINCHAGRLPFYRGRNVLNWVLINDEPDFGVTVHYIDEGIDTGDIILQQRYEISDDDDYKTLLERSFDYCADTLYRSIKLIQSGEAKSVSQKSIHPVGFYCSRRRVGDERLDWNQSARDIFNFVRAITDPGPRARTVINDAEVSIKRVELIRDAPVYKGTPGSILSKVHDGYLVKTRDSFIKVTHWDGPASFRVGDRFQ